MKKLSNTEGELKKSVPYKKPCNSNISTVLPPKTYQTLCPLISLIMIPMGFSWTATFKSPSKNYNSYKRADILIIWKQNLITPSQLSTQHSKDFSLLVIFDQFKSSLPDIRTESSCQGSINTQIWLVLDWIRSISNPL